MDTVSSTIGRDADWKKRVKTGWPGVRAGHVTVQDLDLAERSDGGRHRFDGAIVPGRGGAFGDNVRVIPATTCSPRWPS